MLFNERYAISYINFNTGFIAIDHNEEEYIEEEPITGLVRGFSRLIGEESESFELVEDEGLGQKLVDDGSNVSEKDVSELASATEEEIAQAAL